MKFQRSYALDDITIRSGDGRTVEAYAAVFDTPARIHDRQGHYLERIARSAFDATWPNAAPVLACSQPRPDDQRHHRTPAHCLSASRWRSAPTVEACSPSRSTRQPASR